MILDHHGNEITVPDSVDPAVDGEMIKAWKRLPTGSAKRAPKSLFFDPMTLMYSLGYKDRKFSMTYDVIRKVAQQLSLTSAIIKHRISQVCEFCSPFRLSKHASGLGFEIKHKNPDRMMSASEKRFAAELEQFILYCGRPRRNQYGDKRDDFETFTKKFLRDLLELDQGCHPAGTLVELADGTSLPIEQILPGMEVRTHNRGRSKPVIEVTAREYTGKMYTVISGGLTVTATDGHPLLVVRDKGLRFRDYGNPEWVKASALRAGYYLTYPKSSSEKKKFVSTPKRPREPYLQDDDYFYLRITSVISEDVENYPVFNMEVEEDHSYIANGVISHNCFELVPDRRGRPFEVIPVDGTTVRIAADDPYMNEGLRRLQNEAIQTMVPRLGTRVKQPQYLSRTRRWDSKIGYVQVIRGQIETLYKDDEMAFCIMNPRTDLQVNGYGQSNVELLIRIITAHLYAEQHNLNMFKQGSLPKAIINIVGEQVDPGTMENFKRQWHAQLTGVQNVFKTPVLSGPEVQYIPMQGSNQEMEFNNWINYLIRLHCAVWQIDPAEISFELTSSQGQFAPPQYETAAEWKIKKSKDRGLRPLLRFYAYVLNKHIIDRVDDHFYLDFVGLDELSQKDRLELRQQEATVFKTINEVRESENLPPLEDGDVVANPTYLQWKQMQLNQQQMEQEQQQQQQQQQQMGQDQQPSGQQEGQQPSGQQEGQEAAEKSLGADLQAKLDHARGYVEVLL